MKFIHETLALLFRHALNQIDPCQILVDLFEGVCVESQVSCTLQVFFVIATYFAAAFWFVIILMAWLYVSACHHKLCLYLLD